MAATVEQTQHGDVADLEGQEAQHSDQRREEEVSGARDDTDGGRRPDRRGRRDAFDHAALTTEHETAADEAHPRHDPRDGVRRDPSPNGDDRRRRGRDERERSVAGCGPANLSLPPDRETDREAQRDPTEDRPITRHLGHRMPDARREG